MASKIFLDSGDPAETKGIIALLERAGKKLDGQTTNPTLVSKNPYAKERFERGEKFSKKELLDFYRRVVTDIAKLIPQGSVSIEVYADRTTTRTEMVAQALEMWQWISNAHIKLPTTAAGIQAAQQLLEKNKRVNMTLCFSQAQAAAVYCATKGAPQGSVLLSPFIGRLDDIGQNGMQLIANIIRMYEGGDGEVEVLTASVRSVDHINAALQLGSDIITAPLGVLESWGGTEPAKDYQYAPKNLTAIPYEEADLGKDWTTFNLHHKLTDKGIDRFAEDWNKLIKS